MMNFSWRRKRGGRGGNRTNEASQRTKIDKDLELTTPSLFKCPISLDLMKDPVTLSTGITYDRESIEKWIEAGNITCPVTNQLLRNFDQIPSHSIRKTIQDWCVQNKAWGIERIPTPRIPVTPCEVSSICSAMKVASEFGDASKCLDLLIKIQSLAKESERNKRCIVGSGIGLALAESFESFSRLPVEENEDFLKEALAALTWALPLDQEACMSKMKSAASLRSMVSFLKSGNGNDLSSRQHAICMLKNTISSSDEEGCVLGLIMEIEGIEEMIFRILNDPIGPKATKATLEVIRRMMLKSSSALTTLKFVRMGIVPRILEILVDGDKSICEKALGVVDRVCDCKEGRESAYENALTIPLLAKNMLRVSSVATEFSVTSLWKLLCSRENDDCVVEAVRQGTFQKLLVVLQMESDQSMKKKVTEIIKLMSIYGEEIDCFDSSLEFMYIQRPSN